MLFKDWKRAIWRAPLHMLLSLPVAAVTLPLPFVGSTYVKWRIASEADDVLKGLDTPEKAEIDLYTQTALVKSVLKVWNKN